MRFWDVAGPVLAGLVLAVLLWVGRWLRHLVIVLREVVEDMRGTPDRPGVPGRPGVMVELADLRGDLHELRLDVDNLVRREGDREAAHTEALALWETIKAAIESTPREATG